MSEVTVVVPVHRNAGTLRELNRRILTALDGADPEIVLVDDASPDSSGEVIEEIARSDARVRGLRLESNVGQHRAVLTGLRHAGGTRAVVMDADLQDPPEAIPSLIAELERGHDVVFAGRRGAYESPPRLLTSHIFKRLLAAGTGVPPDAGMFFAINRHGVDKLLSMSGPPPFVVAMIGRAGLDASSIPVRRARAGGRSGYSARKRLRSALRGLRWAATRDATE
jgi:glycosyltransferase involved in cell wall biosynthesis